VTRLARLREIVVDCECAPALARFWAAVLDGYAVRPYDAAEIARLAARGRTPETDPAVLVDGPGPILCFQEVRERKTVPNRLHLDVECRNREREVERLLALGATVKRASEGRTVMQDPEGNEFCVVETRT
jgi:hypothetical protein